MGFVYRVCRNLSHALATAALAAQTSRPAAVVSFAGVLDPTVFGASNRFTRTPFILEGVFAALIGSVLAGVAVVALCAATSASAQSATSGWYVAGDAGYHMPKDIKAAVISGEGQHFCAGLDLSADVSSSGSKVGEFKVDPVLIGVGVGYRF